MTIDDKLIEYLEDLSRLSLSEAEKEQAKVDLTRIIGYMATLDSIDTSDMPAISHPFPAVNCFRDDTVFASHDQADILANAPSKNDKFFKAPKTVE